MSGPIHGDPTGAIRLALRSFQDGGCLRWTGAHTTRGYGHMQLGGKRRGVHRVAYELAVGPIPPGMEIDHLCSVRDCINPDHLELVTHLENVRRIYERGRHPRVGPTGLTHCRNGHEFTIANSYLRPDGHIDCRTCKAAARQRSKEKKRVSRQAA